MFRLTTGKVDQIEKQHTGAAADGDDHASRKRYGIGYFKDPVAAQLRLYDLRLIHGMLKTNPKRLRPSIRRSDNSAAERGHVGAVNRRSRWCLKRNPIGVRSV